MDIPTITLDEAYREMGLMGAITKDTEIGVRKFIKYEAKTWDGKMNWFYDPPSRGLTVGGVPVEYTGRMALFRKPYDPEYIPDVDPVLVAYIEDGDKP